MSKPVCLILLQLSFELSWKSLPLVLSLYSGVVGLPALLLAAVCLVIGRLRRFGPTRWLGYGSAAIGIVFFMGPVMLLLQTGWSLSSEKVNLAQRTHVLAQDTTYDGTAYPAGSLVVLREGTKSVESGKLPRPTTMMGLRVAGEFSRPLQPGETTASLDAMLVQPAMVAGLPCAAGAFFLGEQSASCLLAQDFTFLGFPLAADTFVQLNRGNASVSWYLSQGTLARPVTMFDVELPAGTVVAPGGQSLAELMHQSANRSGVQPVCLPAGAVLKLRDAVFHGVLQIAFEGELLMAQGPCSFHRKGWTDKNDGPRGFVELAGGKHIGMGSQERPGAAWVEDEIYEGKGTY